MDDCDLTMCPDVLLDATASYDFNARDDMCNPPVLKLTSPRRQVEDAK